ncbi:hypothetical protein GIB67_007268 [Kingdonia uniflora]|uniref:Uncharacterized protein n=1 Tax=Kingdonia uniflora TaxID=39325 RepID=A0A7J7NX12_9MAGN|nr:hypothetical protein GIB67_007268 [Kingdonia uniflora]
MDYVLLQCTALQDRLTENEIEQATLTKEAKTLEIEAQRSEPSMGSPQNDDAFQGHRSGSITSYRDLFSMADINVLRRSRSKTQS